MIKLIKNILKPKEETFKFQNDELSMKDALPLVNKGLLIPPMKMEIVYISENIGYSVGDIIEIDFTSMNEGCGLVLENFLEGKKVAKLRDGSTIIKARKI